jgi:Fe-S oxidoreductase
MCPSYQATLDEKNSTRARANILREFIYAEPAGNSRLDHPEIYEILDLCLSCKACKSECPSSIDMAKLKGEFLQQWYDKHGIPLRTRIIANMPHLYRLGRPLAWILNPLMSGRLVSGIIKRIARFHPDRSLPLISPSIRRKMKSWVLAINPTSAECRGSVYVYLDELTEYQEAELGLKTVQLLTGLGYRVHVSSGILSARTYISKGLLRKARKLVRKSILFYQDKISKEVPLIGIEPSAILGFRDEFPDLVGQDLKEQARNLGNQCLLLEEFLEREIRAGKIHKSDFTDDPRSIMLHGHCQQKAVASTGPTLFVLNFPENMSCTEIPSGCCGMAGSFGFEKEHFDLSVSIGEMVLFPAVRSAGKDVVICAPGTSCRHHIKDSTGKIALHPAEVLLESLAVR